MPKFLEYLEYLFLELYWSHIREIDIITTDKKAEKTVQENQKVY